MCIRDSLAHGRGVLVLHEHPFALDLLKAVALGDAQAGEGAPVVLGGLLIFSCAIGGTRGGLGSRRRCGCLLYTSSFLRLLISILIYKALKEGQEQDLDIQPHGPVFNVIQVVFNTFFN